MAKTKEEKYDINHRWVDTADNIYRVSPTMSVSIEMADYNKSGDYTWNLDDEDMPCDFMELMLIPPKDSRFYKNMLEPNEALVARIWFEPSSNNPLVCELVKEDPNRFHIEYSYNPRDEKFETFSNGMETVEFTEEESRGIIDFARKAREFHTALGIKEYKGEEYINDFLYDHTLSSENSVNTKQFADWVNNEFGTEILSQKNAEKILEYYAEHEFNLLIGSDGKLYEYDPQEGFPDGFAEQSFENIIENTMGMIEQNGEIERESDEMKAILKADLKAMEKVAKKMIDAKNGLAKKNISQNKISIEEFNRAFTERGGEYRNADELRNGYYNMMPADRSELERDSMEEVMIQMGESALASRLDIYDDDIRTEIRGFVEKIIFGEIKSENIEETLKLLGVYVDLPEQQKDEYSFTIRDTEQLDRIKSVFGLPLDMSAYAEYITRAESEALEFYDDSTQRENGYSFKDYAGGQMALGFLSDMYPEFSLMEDYLPDLGWHLDEICTKIASGEIKTFKDVRESLTETINKLKESTEEKDVDKINIYLEDIRAEKPVLSDALGKVSDFIGKRVTAEDFNEFIGITDCNENENLEYRITDMLSTKLQSIVATVDELEKDDNCKLQNAAFDMAARILSGDEKIEKNAALGELTQYGIKVGVIEEKDEPSVEKENSKEHDRAMRNLRTAISGIKNGYNDSLDDYVESLYTRKGMWSVHQKTEKENLTTEIRYSDNAVFEISGGEMRIPAGAKKTLDELEAKGIQTEDIRKEVAKMYPEFRLGLTKKEFGVLEKVIANIVFVDAENKCAFRASDGTYLSAKKMLEYTNPEKQSQIERDMLGDRREKLSDSDKTVFENIQKKLSEVSVEKTPNEALTPALKDLHVALDGIVNRYNNNLDVYIEDRKTEKGSWAITKSSDKFNNQISIDYEGKPFAIIEKDTVVLLAAKTKIEKMGIDIEGVMSEIGTFDEKFSVSLTKEEASFIDEISQTLREHDSIIVGENEHPYDMDNNCYISRKALLEYIDTELDEMNPEQKKEWLDSLSDEKKTLYENLKAKLSESDVIENTVEQSIETELSDLHAVLDGYINENTSLVDEYDPGHGAKKGLWEIKEKAVNQDTGEMSEFEIRYKDMIVADVKNNEITNRISEVHYEDEIKFDNMMVELKKFYPELREAISKDEFDLAPSLNDRFKWLAEGADAMSAEKFGTAEEMVEKAFEGLSDNELVALMEMKNEDGNTAIKIWENEYSYLQNVNEIEDFEDKDVAPSSLAEVRTAQDKADGIKFMRQKEGLLRLRHDKYRAVETLMNFVNEKFSAEILDMPDAARILYEYWETSSDIIIDEKNGDLFWQRDNEEMENVDVFDMLNDIEIWNNGLVEEGWANDPVMKKRYEQTNEMLSRVKENIKKAREKENPFEKPSANVSYSSIIELQDFFGAEHLENGEMVKGFSEENVKLAENDTMEFYEDSAEKEKGYSKEQYFLMNLAAEALNERFAGYPGWREMSEHSFPERFPTSQDSMAMDVIEKLGLGLDGANKIETPTEKIRYMSSLDKTIDGMTNFIELQEILYDDMKSGLRSQNIASGLDGDWCFYDMSDSRRTLNFTGLSGTHVLEMDKNTKKVSYDIKAWNLIEDKTGLKMEEILSEAERIYSQDISLGLKFPNFSSEEKTEPAQEKTIKEYTTLELMNEIRKRDDFIGGKIWVKDDIRNHINDMKHFDDSLDRFGDIDINEKTIDKIADCLNKDALCDCTDEEWNAIGEAVETYFELEEEKTRRIHSIKSKAVSAKRGVNIDSVLKEAKEKNQKKQETNQPTQKKDIGLGR